MSEIDSEGECLWDLLTEQSQKKQAPGPKIKNSRDHDKLKTKAPIQTPTIRNTENLKNSKKYSGSSPKVSLADGKSQHQHKSLSKEPTEEEKKWMELTEELKDIKVKVERAKNNRKELKKMYEERNKSDPHKDKRHLSFDDLRGEYVGLLVKRETRQRQIKLLYDQLSDLEASNVRLLKELLSSPTLSIPGDLDYRTT